MNNIKKWEKIKNILKYQPDISNNTARSELVEQLSIYHEELLFQNEELSRFNNHLEELKNDYQELFDFAPIAYFIINKKRLIVEANAKAKLLFGDVLQTSITQYVAPDSRKDIYLFLKTLFQERKSRKDIVFISWDTSIHMEVIAKKIVSKKDRFLVACIDCNKQYKTIQKMSNFSYKDHLTGLYNRRYFEKEIRNINPQKDLPYSLLIADVNGLKVLNDSFGHHRGDELLEKAAQIMSELNRKRYIISRIGGDEFAVLLPSTSSSDCKKIMGQFQKACSKLTINDIKFSISFGAATMTAVDEDIDNILIEAEEEMYRNKNIHEAETSTELIESIFTILCKRCPKEKLHSKKVAQYMKKFGEYMKYDQEYTELLELAGLFHNIGKVAIDYNILHKIEPLSSTDSSEIKKIPEIAYRILKSSSKFSKIAHIILYSHEWIDGGGYPKGLTGECIPFESKLLSVCDAFGAMTSDRPYRMAMTKSDALAELEACVETQFDKDVVKDFVKIIRSGFMKQQGWTYQQKHCQR
ncbi:MAG: hypothetical protein CSA21_06300 [Deltaproteobacteria bacterium]|nr:MAG: hypothetical protein CSA21_06300 [Deltaproteobacteria bacterium]